LRTLAILLAGAAAVAAIGSALAWRTVPEDPWPAVRAVILMAALCWHLAVLSLVPMWLMLIAMRPSGQPDPVAVGGLYLLGSIVRVVGGLAGLVVALWLLKLPPVPSVLALVGAYLTLLLIESGVVVAYMLRLTKAVGQSGAGPGGMDSSRAEAPSDSDRQDTSAYRASSHTAQKAANLAQGPQPNHRHPHQDAPPSRARRARCVTAPSRLSDPRLWQAFWRSPEHA
jgi:hypothetical protein